MEYQIRCDSADEFDNVFVAVFEGDVQQRHTVHRNVRPAAEIDGDPDRVDVGFPHSRSQSFAVAHAHALDRFQVFAPHAKRSSKHYQLAPTKLIIRCPLHRSHQSVKTVLSFLRSRFQCKLPLFSIHRPIFHF